MDLILRLRDQGLSYRAIEKKIGISKSVVHSLVTTFAGNIPAKPKTTMPPKRISGKRAPIESPKGGVMSAQTESAEEKIARLERELESAKLESELYKEIISVAEKNFRIRILKKAGAKQ